MTIIVGGCRGVVLVAVYDSGQADPRIFGDVRRYELAWAGAVLAEHSVNGEFEPTVGGE
jgi:hypothetical protein